MEQKGLVKSSINLPGFVEDAYNSVEAMTKFSDLLLQSKLCPDHFYEKGPDNKPDYTKGKTAAVMMVLLQGHQLQLPPLTALQHVIPVNGLLSIKGDAAKTLIFNSGKIEPGSWKETITGSVSEGTYECTITAQRSDTKETMSRTFGVVHAKRAGLWIDEAKIRGNDGWKYQKSAWYKYPERMMAYRALGFLARDLFPDVLSGIYTTEEAIDMPVDTTVVVETNGVEVKIPDTEFNKSRSEDLTTKANNAIDKRAGDLEPPPKEEPEVEYKEPTPEDFKGEPAPEKQRGSTSTMLNGTPGFVPVYTEEELKGINSPELNTMVECDGLMVKARDINPGKNTHKKLRDILLAFYAGEIVPLIAQYDPEYQDPLNQEGKRSDPATTDGDEVLASEQAAYEAGVEEEVKEKAKAEVDPEDPSTWPEGNEAVQPNEGFDATTPDPGEDTNEFEIEIPDLVEGKRGFDQVKTLFEELANKAGIDNNAYDTLVKTKFPEFQKYRSKEDFCYMGETSEINTLLNSI